MNRLALALLVFCNLIWAMNSLMGKVLLHHFHGVQVAWLRYASGFLVYLLFAAIRVLFFGGKWREYFLVPPTFLVGLELGAIGIGPFVFTPIMQFVGLETAQAMENAILVATEPLITVVLARGVLGEKMTRDQIISLSIALVGVLLFAGIFSGGFAGGISIGVIFLLLAQIGESAYSVFTRKLVLIYEPKAVLGTALALGAILLTGFVAAFDRLPDLSLMNASDLGALFWLGPLGSTMTYLIWASISRSVTIPSMAITLFIQPVVGSLAGYLLLDERLTVERAFGAILILAAIALLAAREIQKGNRFAS